MAMTPTPQRTARAYTVIPCVGMRFVVCQGYYAGCIGMASRVWALADGDYLIDLWLDEPVRVGDEHAKSVLIEASATKRVLTDVVSDATV